MAADGRHGTSFLASNYKDTAPQQGHGTGLPMGAVPGPLPGESYAQPGQYFRRETCSKYMHETANNSYAYNRFLTGAGFNPVFLKHGVARSSAAILGRSNQLTPLHCSTSKLDHH